MENPMNPAPPPPPRRRPETGSRPRYPPPPRRDCSRCNSSNTKFCYYNNYSIYQPRHFCKDCRRYWTHGGTLRNVPVGGGARRNRRPRTAAAAARLVPPAAGILPLPIGNGGSFFNLDAGMNFGDAGLYDGAGNMMLPPHPSFNVDPSLGQSFFMRGSSSDGSSSGLWARAGADDGENQVVPNLFDPNHWLDNNDNQAGFDPSI